MTSVRLPASIDQRLGHLSAITKRSKSFYIKEALEQYLEDMEDIMIAVQRLSKRDSVSYSSAEVLKHLKEHHKAKAAGVVHISGACRAPKGYI